MFEQNCKVRLLRLHLDPACDDARDIHKVVDEPHEMAQLPFHHLASPMGGLTLLAIFAQHMQTVMNGGQRIAQLIRASIARNSFFRLSASARALAACLRSEISIKIFTGL